MRAFRQEEMKRALKWHRRIICATLEFCVEMKDIYDAHTLTQTWNIFAIWGEKFKKEKFCS